MALSASFLRYEDGERGEKNALKFSALYRVDGVTPTTVPYLITKATGLPRIGDFIGPCAVKSIKARRTDATSLLNLVTVEYDSEALGRGGSGDQPGQSGGNNSGDPNDPDPVERPDEFQVEAAKTRVAVEYDEDDEALVNSAGCPFDPPVEKEEPYAVVRVTRYLDDWTPDEIEQYVGKLNADQFLGKNPRLWLCTNIGAQTVYENANRWWRVTYEFAFNADEWTARPIDKGRLALPTAEADEPEAPRDGKGVALNREVLLNEDGTRRDDAEEPHVLNFRIYAETAFAGLGIAWPALVQDNVEEEEEEEE